MNDNITKNNNSIIKTGTDFFPKDFILGTATSAFQIEGEGKTEWQEFTGQDGTPLGNAINHYERYKQDMEYILYLGNAYRFSMDWSKLQEEPFAPLDKDALAHYEFIFKTLRENNKKVCLVLNHFSNPKWLFDMGGWTNSKCINIFFDYAKQVIDRYYEYINIINTFNEPNGYALLTYLMKEFPPKKFSIIGWNNTLNNMAKAHEKIYDFVKDKYPQILVGISHVYMYMQPLSEKSLYQKAIIKFSDLIQNENIHERFTKNGKFDYIGFSYYGRLLIGKNAIVAYNKDGRKFLDDNGLIHDDLWEIYPEGIYKNIKFFYEKYKKPVLITENGVCTNDDNLRIKSIHDHLEFVLKAVGENIPVLGYFHWSTFDNFELAYGPSRRFGLVAIDFKDPLLERKIKDSGKYYHEIVQSGILK
jgi:beta-glucosidase